MMARKDEVSARIKRGEVISREDLSGADLSGVDLSGGVFERVDLRAVNLSSSRLK